LWCLCEYIYRARRKVSWGNNLKSIGKYGLSNCAFSDLVDRAEAFGMGAATVGVSKAGSTIVSAGDTSRTGGDDIVPFSFTWLRAKILYFCLQWKRGDYIKRVINIGNLQGAIANLTTDHDPLRWGRVRLGLQPRNLENSGDFELLSQEPNLYFTLKNIVKALRCLRLSFPVSPVRRMSSTTSEAATKALDYEGWSSSQLVERIKQLESQLAVQAPSRNPPSVNPKSKPYCLLLSSI
jgi:hypothetical protein